MPKTKLQNVIFTLIMAFVMVYAMVCYNISIDKGGMSNQIFLLAFYEMPIMWPVAFILEFFVVEKLSKFLAFRIVSPTDKPIFIILAISSMIVCLMCPAMSFIATVLFKQRNYSCLVTDNCNELPNGTVLADFLCRTICEKYIWKVCEIDLFISSLHCLKNLLYYMVSFIERKAYDL